MTRVLAALIAVLVVVDVILADQARWTVVVAVAGTIVILLVAHRAGVTRVDIGLSRDRFGAGLRWGGVISALVLVAFTVAAFLPSLTSAFDDDRTPDGAAGVLMKVLVVIPLRTVLLEEIAFRGVLWGYIARHRGHVRATVVSSVLFGLWHVPIAIVSLRTNEGLERFAGDVLASVVVVVTVVIAMTIAGVILSELRRRSGSLIAPALVHWTVNSAGTIVGALHHTLAGN